MHGERATDIRASERRTFQGTVQVLWQGRSGEVVVIRGKCLDISEQGVRIACDQPLDVRANVYLRAPAFGLMGNATVRYCRRSGTKHIVGLMFSALTSQAELGRKRCLTESQTDMEG